MNETYAVLFPILMAMVLIWFVLVKAIFVRLERGHPEKFEELGKPSLFWNNSPKNGFATMRFLFKREHLALDNPTLSKLCDFALAFLLLYTVLFLILFSIPFYALLTSSAT